MENFYKRKGMGKYIEKMDNPNFDIHNFNAPFYAIVNAPSGSGKTNFLCNLLQAFCKGKGTFHDIMIFCKSRDEPLYKYLSDTTQGQIKIEEDLRNLPQINTLNKKEPSCIVFDDLVLDKNPLIPEYFIRCRKQNCSVIFLSQSFYAIPKIIRINTRYFIILRMSGSRDVNMLLKDSSIGLEKKELLKMYKYATQDKFDCFIIDNDSIEKKFRRNFLEYLDPEDFKG